MIVSINKKLIEPSLWKTNSLWIYALSRSVIGISPKEITEWKLKSLHFEQVKCSYTQESIKFRLPDILYNFYWLMDKDMKYSLCGMKDSVLMIIERKATKPIYKD